MQRTRRGIFLSTLIVISILAGIIASADLLVAAPQKEIPEDVKRAVEKYTNIRILNVDRRNIPKFIRGRLGRIQGEVNDQRVIAAIKDVLPMFRAKEDEIQSKGYKTDLIGNRHFDYQQKIMGRLVIGADLRVHVNKSGEIYAISGNIRSDLDLPSEPKISMAEGEKAALLSTPSTAVSEKTELVYVVSNRDESVHLAYKVDLVGKAKHDVVFIDAIDGSFVTRHPKLYDAKDRYTFSADYTWGETIRLVRTEGSSPSGDSVVDAAYDNSGIVYDYYANTFGRDSIDNNGWPLGDIVHMGTGFNNAGWDSWYGLVICGDGDGYTFSPLCSALDVVGHEFTHGVIEFTIPEGGLVYDSESGALNEAVADVFGASIEAYHYGVSEKTWKCGEDAYTPYIPGDALRYFYSPTLDGISSDYYPERYAGEDDNHGVHMNSGIANLAFYLLANGGMHPRGKTTIVVPSLGFNAAQRIFYEALYHTSSNDGFEQFRSATETAANILYGSSAEAAVGLAWDAVGVRQIFVDIPFSYNLFNYITAVYDAGFTYGCSQNPNYYCPRGNVTRGDAAAWTIRALYGENFSYTTTPYFSDVPPEHWAFKYVQKLKDLGLTTMTGTFSVNDWLTRGMLATLIIRAKYGENFSYTTTPYFSDVPPEHWAFKYVQKFKDDGITVFNGVFYVDEACLNEWMAPAYARAFLGMP
jgi:vibriolysin